MRIALFGPAYPFRGGIAQTSNNVYRTMLAAGHEAHLVNFKRQFPRWLFPGKTQYEDAPPAVPIPSERVFTLWNPLSWLRTARTIARLDPDLIVFSWWMPLFGFGYWVVARLLPKRYRARIVYLLHNVIPHERRIGDVFQSKLALGTARYYVTLSRGEARELSHLFPRVDSARIKSSPLPAFEGYPPFDGDRAAAQKQIDAEAARLLLFFGFVRAYKGLDVLLRAMPEIWEYDPEIKLVIAGEFYQDRATYDTLIASLDRRDQVLIRDSYLSGDKVGVYFAACDCLVLPYRTATQSAIVPIAYELDTPVIATNVGGLPEVIENGASGYVVPPEDPSAIAKAVREFFAAGGRPALVDAVRRKRRELSWEALAATIGSFAE